MKTYQEYCEAVRLRESSGKYDCKNSYGYLGAYQFGKARLCDLGLCKRKDEHSYSMSNGSFVFIPPITEESFLADKELQDKTFDKHVQLLKKQVFNLAGKNKFDVEGGYKGIAYTLSGCIAVCHLTGPQSLVNLLIGRTTEVKDAFGTDTTEYLFKFSGYEIP